MIRTAIVHNHDNLTLDALRDLIAKAIPAETTIAPCQLKGFGATLPGATVDAVHVITANPVCFRLPEPGEVAEFRESCMSLQRYSPPEWETLILASGCVFVESSHAVSVHSRQKGMTVYSIPMLQPTHPVVQETIWKVAAALDALVLSEDGQLIWRPGESSWSEPSLKGGRTPIATKGGGK